MAGLTGLSAHTIRIWERRYNALSPERSATNRRIYTDAQVERLRLLKHAVESGHSIGHVANLPDDGLRALQTAVRPAAVSTADANGFLSACMDAIQRLNPEALEQTLVRANAALGTMGLLNGVAIPLLATIETGYMTGAVRIAQEHMASAVLRGYFGEIRASLSGSRNAPRLLVTTPRNQHHEFGALMVSIVAAMQAWSVTYLGPNLPAEEIADAVRLSGARALALSIVYPTDDPSLGEELRELREEVGPRFPILVGGRAVGDYASALDEIGAVVCPSLQSLRDELERVG